ncbi:hypothetical protein B0H17DRAFT_1131261 [Mycena rosella]|uniref:Uncharacterized protein n=1 Tax=Mycena rosella TaxID=1033263 RepID=A0AAD7DQZ0_MYCRO|nr:hypothetical protein B0H17DRAFT_1131261 [Mycena rosella]
MYPNPNSGHFGVKVCRIGFVYHRGRMPAEWEGTHGKWLDYCESSCGGNDLSGAHRGTRQGSEDADLPICGWRVCSGGEAVGRPKLTWLSSSKWSKCGRSLSLVGIHGFRWDTTAVQWWKHAAAEASRCWKSTVKNRGLQLWCPPQGNNGSKPLLKLVAGRNPWLELGCPPQGNDRNGVRDVARLATRVFTQWKPGSMVLRGERRWGVEYMGGGGGISLYSARIVFLLYLWLAQPPGPGTMRSLTSVGKSSDLCWKEQATVSMFQARPKWRQNIPQCVGGLGSEARSLESLIVW